MRLINLWSTSSPLYILFAIPVTWWKRLTRMYHEKWVTWRANWNAINYIPCDVSYFNMCMDGKICCLVQWVILGSKSQMASTSVVSEWYNPMAELQVCSLVLIPCFLYYCPLFIRCLKLMISTTSFLAIQMASTFTKWEPRPICFLVLQFIPLLLISLVCECSDGCARAHTCRHSFFW